MQWDLGLWGVGLLAGMAVAFGFVAQLIMQTSFRWTWLVAAASYFLAGNLISEVWFGWATQAELQPNIDGLSFDEVFLIATLSGIVVAFAVRHATRRRRETQVNEGDPNEPHVAGGRR